VKGLNMFALFISSEGHKERNIGLKLSSRNLWKK
jgi:hypothetical protein